MFNTEQANCVSIDPDLFFPEGAMKPQIETYLQRICYNCVIMNDCLNYALRVKVKGYWAATTENQRDDLRRFFGIIPVRLDQEFDRMYRQSTKREG